MTTLVQLHIGFDTCMLIQNLRKLWDDTSVSNLRKLWIYEEMEMSITVVLSFIDPTIFQKVSSLASFH